ncbi:unnamed protein product [Victoria cruziana]
MGLDNDPSDPSPRHRRPQAASSLSSTFRRQPQPRDDGEGWSILLRRHRFLLTMLALLAFLCTIYLYFAVTLGASDPCSGMTGAEKTLCRQAKSSIHKGKLRFL